MRKIFAIAVAVMLLPFTAFGLEMVTDDVLSDVTGQAGVSIAVDDIKLFQRIESLMYTDTDGLAGPDDAASIGLSTLEMMVHINGITMLSEIATPGTAANEAAGAIPFSPGRPVQGTYTYANAAGDQWFNTSTAGAGEEYNDSKFQARALTIDVTEELPVLSSALCANHGVANGTLKMAGVQIGLPTIEIHMEKVDFDIVIEASDAVNGGGAGALADNSYGKLSLTNMSMLILDGEIEIAPH